MVMTNLYRADLLDETGNVGVGGGKGICHSGYSSIYQLTLP